MHITQKAILTTLILSLTNTPLTSADGCHQVCEKSYSDLAWDGSCGISCHSIRTLCQDTCHKRLTACTNNCLKLYPCHEAHDECRLESDKDKWYEFRLCDELCQVQAGQPATCEQQCDKDWSRGMNGEEDTAGGWRALDEKKLWLACRVGCGGKQLPPRV